MKKSIITIAIVISSVFGISKSGFAATSTNEAVTTLTEASKISKIEIHGNVELYVSDGSVNSADQIKVYNHYYAEDALVQDQNGVLRISSYNAKKLIVWVTVSNLQDMSIYDNAEVKSFGKLSAVELDVKLHDNATARLNMDAYSANITLNDHAKADLTGTITEAELHYDRSATLNTTDLAAAHLVKKVNFDVRDAVEFASL